MHGFLSLYGDSELCNNCLPWPHREHSQRYRAAAAEEAIEKASWGREVRLEGRNTYLNRGKNAGYRCGNTVFWRNSCSLQKKKNQEG